MSNFNNFVGVISLTNTQSTDTEPKSLAKQIVALGNNKHNNAFQVTNTFKSNNTMCEMSNTAIGTDRIHTGKLVAIIHVEMHEGEVDSVTGTQPMVTPYIESG